MRLKVILFLLFVSPLACAATYVVNSPVVNMHKTASSDAPVISQAIYGERVAVMAKTGGWAWHKYMGVAHQ